MTTTKFATSLLFFVLFGIVLLGTQAAKAADVVFEIHDIKNDQGKLMVQVFHGQDNFAKGRAITAQILAARPGTTSVTFNNLPAGEYAIRYFHDENDDNELATNLVGMPTEGYGFSNNAQPNFGPPHFDQMKFQVNDDDTVIKNSSTIIY